MISKKQLVDWLNVFPEDSLVFIDKDKLEILSRFDKYLKQTCIKVGFKEVAKKEFRDVS